MSVERTVTRWLNAWSSGDREGAERAIGAVYPDLERIARRLFGTERRDHTLEPRALIHQLYLILERNQPSRFADRQHFLAVAARTMRHVLVDHARGRNRLKRGRGLVQVPLDERTDTPPAREARLVALDDALHDLGRCDPRKAALVELRVFGGLTCAEAAACLEISARTADRDWRLAKAFLVRALASEEESYPLCPKEKPRRAK